MNDAIVIGASSDSKLISECIKYIVILLNINEEKKSKRENKNKNEDALKTNIIKQKIQKYNINTTIKPRIQIES